MQYTIRKIPHSLDAILRRRAREQGKSLNEVAVEALVRGAGLTGERGRQRDLRDIAGTWRSDRDFDRAFADQDAHAALRERVALKRFKNLMSKYGGKLAFSGHDE